MASPSTPPTQGDQSSTLQLVVSTVQSLVQAINNGATSLGKTLKNIKPSILIGNPTDSDSTLQAITLDASLAFISSTLAVSTSWLTTFIQNTFGTIFLPPGQVATFAMSTPPSGWLICDGSAVSRTTYANLFTAIGTVWGSGDGSTTFNIPDFRGQFLRGWDDGAGVDPGRAFASSQTDAFASHTHTVTDPGHTHTVTDPGHIHAITDPGHTHTVPDYALLNSNNATLINEGSGLNTPLATSSATTGITINSHTTGITNASATTGITNASTGGTETRPKNYAVLICIRT